MKECDILREVQTYSDPSYIFSGDQAPSPLPMLYALVWVAASHLSVSESCCVLLLS